MPVEHQLHYISPINIDQARGPHKHTNANKKRN